MPRASIFGESATSSTVLNLRDLAPGVPRASIFGESATSSTVLDLRDLAPGALRAPVFGESASTSSAHFNSSDLHDPGKSCGSSAAVDSNKQASFKFVAINAGKTCGTRSGVLHLTAAAQVNGAGLDCAYVSEFDGKLRSFDFGSKVQRWTVHRYWPGKGSFAWAFVIASKYQRFVRNVHRMGRAGAIHLCTPALDLFLVGVHLAHKEAFGDSVAETAQVLLLKPPKAQLYLAGDMNIDLLLAIPGLLPNAVLSNEELERLDTVLGLAAMQKLVLAVPKPSITPSGGPYSLLSLDIPLSRVPDGKQCDNQKASCLDFAFVPKKSECAPYLSWHMRPADHAFLHLDIPNAKPNVIFQSSTVRLLDWNLCEDWLQLWVSAEHYSIGKFIALARLFIMQCKDKRNRQQRHDDRIPPHVKQLFESSDRAQSEDARRHLRSQALCFLRAHHQAQRADQARAKHKHGRIIRSVSHLHRISSMVFSSQASGDAAAGQISGDRSKWQHEVVFEFAQRWASKDLQTRAVLNDLIAATEGAILDISVTELFDALDVIKPSSRLDDDGLTPDVLRVIGFTCPLLVIHIVQSLLASREAVERCVIVAQIKGKLSSTTAARDVRAILPSSAL